MAQEEKKSMDEIDQFMNTYGLLKYSDKLKEGGLESLKMLKDELTADDIKELSADPTIKMSVLHRKKFIKACVEYREGKYSTTKSASLSPSDDPTCPKCKGNGFTHKICDKKHEHKDRNRKCFYCAKCSGCGGSCKVNTPYIVCPKCSGQGWNHKICDKPHERAMELREPCFYCQKCSGCNGKGYLAGNNPNVYACLKCNNGSLVGTGWTHKICDHKHERSAAKNEPCFYCEKCTGCGAKGYVVSKTAIVACPKCKTNGFTHKICDHKHERPTLNEACFYCEKCSGCGGRGWLQGDKKYEDCVACKASGYRHDSGKSHERATMDQPCYYCKKCNACAGKGYTAK
eukprot:56080_1